MTISTRRVEGAGFWIIQRHWRFVCATPSINDFLNHRRVEAAGFWTIQRQWRCVYVTPSMYDCSNYRLAGAWRVVLAALLAIIFRFSNDL